MYRRETSDGEVYEFVPATHTLTGFETVNGAQAGPDSDVLVAADRLEDSEGRAYGRGDSANPDRAEAYAYLDIQDTDANPVAGRAKLVVLNSANRVLATIAQFELSRARRGDPSTGVRGDWGVPFKYRSLRNGRGEVIGDDYQIGLTVRTESGTATVSLDNSTMTIEGYQGEKLS